ncbi:hypothetical protein [Hahella ganghwensis]|uniref:hypothetical protein n=1 Tax=Hahella ganghwensis TaxID=286420 RepID=UPI0012F81596|nr:hypothetical protein [Hahella ganghwensis]
MQSSKGAQEMASAASGFDASVVCRQALSRISALQFRGGRRVIGLAGLPGSGKSTFCRLLGDIAASEFPGKIQVVGMDGSHCSLSELADFPEPRKALERRGAPWTFNSKSVAEKISRFRTSSDVDLYWPDFDHARGDPEEDAISICAGIDLLLVEGLYMLYPGHGFQDVVTLLDEKWFLDVPYEESMRRLVLRHQQAWGISEDEAKKRVAANDAHNAQIVLGTKALADWVIDWNEPVNELAC